MQQYKRYVVEHFACTASYPNVCLYTYIPLHISLYYNTKLLELYSYLILSATVCHTTAMAFLAVAYWKNTWAQYQDQLHLSLVFS